MKKEIEFECGHCWEFDNVYHFKFKRDDWRSIVSIDECGESYIKIETLCPLCGNYCYRDFSLNELLDMIFKLQVEVERVKLIK